MICPQCGKEFEPAKAATERAKKKGMLNCCSKSCATKNRWERERIKCEIECPTCKSTFSPSSEQIRRLKQQQRKLYCSQKCATKGNRKEYCKRGHLRSAENINNKGDCKLCISLRNKIWCELNPEKRSESHKKANAKWLTTESGKQYQKENFKKRAERFKNNQPERYKEMNRRTSKLYAMRHPEKVKESRKKWVQNNREQVKARYLKYGPKILAWRKKQAAKLTDYYVKSILKMGGREVSTDLIELKRTQLHHHRFIRAAKTAKKEKENVNIPCNA